MARNVIVIKFKCMFLGQFSRLFTAMACVNLVFLPPKKKG